MGCQIPNGCLNDEEAHACPLCDEDGADRIAAYYASLKCDCGRPRWNCIRGDLDPCPALPGRRD